ncbi:PAAR domain-containing protein [Erwinia mallotivora]|uniref:Flagellar L-ring protein FlgH n=1 Tax=Erwinia mallotivora TaxID=69222 RepID=A0A014Q2M5_9GAMM|nr:PAAR domain-containing protein [Erwinia mallotivora]EXU77412.1 flagellar L-ring protein FlgH [Erwinia mallotivora]
MGMPAARALVDKAAHSGPVQSGSPDVIIGGFPAARKNDPVGCSVHGSGIIVGGSGSVFVNGLPLARQGDKTQCNLSGAAVEKKPQTAPPQYWGGSLAKKAGEDGTIHGDHFDATVLSATTSLQDKTADGTYDTASAGFAVADITVGNLKSSDLFRGEMRAKVATVNASETNYGFSGENGITGINTSATAVGMQYGASGGMGKEGTVYGGLAGDVIIGTAEAKAVSEVYSGNSGRYGFSAEAGAEAAALKAEAVTNVDLYGIVVANGKLGATAGSAGAAAGVTGYWDTTNDSLNLKVSGELAAVVGLKGDVEVKLIFEKITDWIFDDETKAAEAKKSTDNGDGTITTGCVTVLVGN